MQTVDISAPTASFGASSFSLETSQYPEPAGNRFTGAWRNEEFGPGAHPAIPDWFRDPDLDGLIFQLHFQQN